MNIMILKLSVAARCVSQVSELPSSQCKERNMNQIFGRSPEYFQFLSSKMLYGLPCLNSVPLSFSPGSPLISLIMPPVLLL